MALYAAGRGSVASANIAKRRVQMPVLAIRGTPRILAGILSQSSPLNDATGTGGVARCIISRSVVAWRGNWPWTPSLRCPAAPTRLSGTQDLRSGPLLQSGPLAHRSGLQEPCPGRAARKRLFSNRWRLQHCWHAILPRKRATAWLSRRLCRWLSSPDQRTASRRQLQMRGGSPSEDSAGNA